MAFKFKLPGLPKPKMPGLKIPMPAIPRIKMPKAPTIRQPTMPMPGKAPRSGGLISGTQKRATRRINKGEISTIKPNSGLRSGFTGVRSMPTQTYGSLSDLRKATSANRL